jgi:hypothetical protein
MQWRRSTAKQNIQLHKLQIVLCQDVDNPAAVQAMLPKTHLSRVNKIYTALLVRFFPRVQQREMKERGQ